ncbi:MAG: bacteriophage Gp15 family protein [Peptococcaceae bacterium]|nr:bacteriophage Gp15 family protein [Peptococcaceae bacterium]
MNILLGLPEDYEGIPISPDFRNMIHVDKILSDQTLSEPERVYSALNQLYPEIPDNIEKAIEGLLWFFRRGEEEAGQSSKKSFDFDQDAGLIYAAFLATYGISLTTVDFLHWWEFMALFEGLPETTMIQRAIYYRTADFSEMGKEERKRAVRIRNAFALKTERVSGEDINKKTLDRVKRRFAEAQRKTGLLDME